MLRPKRVPLKLPVSAVGTTAEVMRFFFIVAETPVTVALAEMGTAKVIAPLFASFFLLLRSAPGTTQVALAVTNAVLR